jgi:CheY-like chemotaxis protein
MTRAAITVLMADDDDDDREMTREAMEDTKMFHPLRCVSDGEALLDYLRRRGRFAEPGAAPRPGLILLDLNMPRKDGLEALDEIKADPDLRRIPVVVLTTSKAEEDVVRSYELGASSFITKPVSFTGLVEVVRALGTYWLEIVELPAEEVGLGILPAA